MELVPYQESDLLEYVRLRNLADPNRPVTSENIQHSDSTRAKDARFARFFVVENGLPIGTANLETPLSNPEHGELELGLFLLPAYLEAAQAIYQEALQAVLPLEPKLLRVSAKEDSWAYPFFLGLGFQEFDRTFSSNLHLESFDAAPFKPLLEKARNAGLEIRTLAQELVSPSFARRYYDAIIEILHDVPAATALQPWDFETWQERTLQGPSFFPEAEFIGFIGGEIAGVSQLLHSSRDSTIQTGLTGVRRAYRRLGIAVTLKVAAAQFAKNGGYTFVRTTNHVINRPMLSINEAMGFIKDPARVYLRKRVLHESP
jgi:GNAT superfamily N-acetyltransferase